MDREEELWEKHEREDHVEQAEKWARIEKIVNVYRNSYGYDAEPPVSTKRPSDEND